MNKLLLLPLLLVGCRTPAARINQVHLGMTEAQVVKILGQPVSRAAAKDGSTTLYYTLAENAGLDAGAYSIHMVGGTVDAYGREGVNGQPNQPHFVAPVH